MLEQLKLLLLTTSVFWASSAIADDIYRSVNEKGVTVYSSSGSSDQAARDLPQIKRTKSVYDLPITDVESCDRHGGIQCASGSDEDGSVVCSDGFREASERFNPTCTEARLEEVSLQLEFNSGKIIEVKGSQPWLSLKTIADSDRPKSLVFTVRNTSQVEATGVEVTLFHPDQTKPLPVVGPTNIQPFALEEYRLRELPNSAPYTYYKMRKKLDCWNCR